MKTKNFLLIGAAALIFAGCASKPAQTPKYTVSEDGFVSTVATSVTMEMDRASAFGKASEKKPVSVPEITICQNEVTYSLWYEVYSWAIANGYSFANKGREGCNGVDGANPQTETLPVTMINWRDAVIWCNAASEKEGLSPVYLYNGAPVKISHNENAEDLAELSEINIAANGYRLPTRIEWEAAARGVDSSAKAWLYTYSGSEKNADKVSWNLKNSSGTVQSIKTKEPNTIELYDMSGNVWEWCNESSTPNKKRRAILGGSYRTAEEKTSVISIENIPLINKYDDLGFRVVKNR